MKIINVIINKKLNKQALKHVGGERVNCPIGVSLQCIRCHWAVLLISRCDKILRSLLLTLSVTRADIFSIKEASTGITFSFELINKRLKIRNLISVITIV